MNSSTDVDFPFWNEIGYRVSFIGIFCDKMYFIRMSVGIPFLPLSPHRHTTRIDLSFRSLSIIIIFKLSNMYTFLVLALALFPLISADRHAAPIDAEPVIFLPRSSALYYLGKSFDRIEIIDVSLSVKFSWTTHRSICQSSLGPILGFFLIIIVVGRSFHWETTSKANLLGKSGVSCREFQSESEETLKSVESLSMLSVGKRLK